MKITIPPSKLLYRINELYIDGILKARISLNEDGTLIHIPYYVLPLTLGNYEIEIIYNSQGYISHFEYEGDEENCQDIQEYFGLDKRDMS